MVVMSELVTVHVRQGALCGRRRETPGGAAFFSFQGVPYARPPIGDLRFQAPQPAEPWAGVRDATKEGSPSLHIDSLSRQLVGDEDCLFLNVFSRRLPTEGPACRPLAVLVWVHGGGFAEGTGNDWGPEPFMEHNVVLVTINYRLGPLGFLSLGTKNVPGNAGLKDQVMALRWVKENVAVFGGDPDNVTLFGESAGAAAVQLHWMSPMSTGLFRRVICQSGCALSWWAISRDALGRARRLALAAGCDPAVLDHPDALLKWLRGVSPHKLVLTVDAAKTREEKLSITTFPFVAVVEPDLPGAFLTTDPHRVLAERLANGCAQRIPIILGVTSHEGIVRLQGVRTPQAWRSVDEHFEYLVPYDLVADRSNTDRTQAICRRIKDFYFGGKRICEKTVESYVHFTTDMMIGHVTTLFARAFARMGAPVYMYEFAYVGRLNFLGPLMGAKRVPGACHADELGYLFHVDRLPKVEPDSPEALVRRRMVRMWVDFAQGGNPTPSLDEEITLKWETFSEAEPKYLRISNELSINSGLFKKRMDFWDNLYRTDERREEIANRVDPTVSKKSRSKL